MEKIYAHEAFAIDSDRLSLIASFIGVAEKLSFSSAADVSGTNASTISRRISRLEDTLGVRLLNRTTRRVSLTEPGRLYYQECRKILASISDADAMVSSFNAEPRGLLRASMPVAFGRLHMSKAISAFLSLHPDVQVEANFTDRFVDLVGEEYDVAIRTGRLQESGLIVRKITHNRRLLVASPSYVEKHGAPQGPQDLLQHNCLRYTNYSGMGWHFQCGDAHEEVMITGSLCSDSSDAVYQAILDGLGIGLVAEYMCIKDIDSGRLVSLMPEWVTMPDAGIFIAYPSTRHLAPKVRAFSDFLITYFRTYPWR